MTTSRTKGGRRGANRRGPRRAVEWFDFEINSALVQGSQSVVNLTANLQDDEKKGMTLVRTIVDLELAAQATGTGGKLSMGIVMVSDDSLAAGAVPDPEDNIDKPGWLWKSLRSFFTSTINDHAQATVVQHDLRGMRKFPASGADLVLIMTNFAGTVTVNVDGLIRMLWMKS